MTAATESRASEVQLSDPSSRAYVENLIDSCVEHDHPGESARGVLQQHQYWDIAHSIQLLLEDQHSSAIGTQARELAERVLDEEGPFSQPPTRTVQGITPFLASDLVKRMFPGGFSPPSSALRGVRRPRRAPRHSRRGARQPLAVRPPFARDSRAPTRGGPP